MIPDKTGTIGSTQGVIESNNPDSKNPNKTKNDEYFGEQEVFYESIKLLITFNSKSFDKDDIQLKFQGCSEKGLCYPPTIRYLCYKNQDEGKRSSAIQNNFVEQNFKNNNIFLILF